MKAETDFFVETSTPPPGRSRTSLFLQNNKNGQEEKEGRKREEKGEKKPKLVGDRKNSKRTLHFFVRKRRQIKTNQNLKTTLTN